jgi:hypothetical protein
MYTSLHVGLLAVRRERERENDICYVNSNHRQLIVGKHMFSLTDTHTYTYKNKQRERERDIYYITSYASRRK